MKENPVVLVINCGSSSVKFSVLDAMNGDDLLSGTADSIGSDNAFLEVNKNTRLALCEGTYDAALQAIAAELEKRHLMESVALIGHRIAHGGSLFSEAVLLDDEVVEKIREISPLAPLHNYANLNGVEAARHLFPSLPQVAVFDTAFHQTLTPEAYVYALPKRYLDELGVRRYGFHGTSHRYVSQQALSMPGMPHGDVGLIVAHLGNGASICAVQNGKSVDTSMGMTPLEGLIMGTRSGDVDFGALAYIAGKTGQSMTDIERMLNKESGLLGLSGLSADLRELEKAYHAGHEGARLAIHAFVHRIARHIGGHAASLKQLNAIVFTGGIGENSVLIRRLVLEHLRVFGVRVDETKNALPNSHGERIISQASSPVMAAVIPTNEEKMIALDAIRVSNAVPHVEFA